MKSLAKYAGALALINMLAAGCGAIPEAKSIRSPDSSNADATKSEDDGSTSQSKTKPKKKSDQTTPSDQTQAQQPAPPQQQQQQQPAALPDSKLGWDGTTFKGTAELMLFPIE